MWMTTTPEVAEPLRQGDLLVDLVLPRFQLPLNYARPSGREPRQGDYIVLPAPRARSFLVVSQCCTIENDHVYALASIRSTPPLTSEGKQVYETGTPQAGAAYVYAAHALAPLERYLENRDGRLNVASFLEIQSYTGDDQELRAARVASMTPEGRRLLRIRLAFFWGRPEAEDEKALAAAGLSAGLNLPEVQA